MRASTSEAPRADEVATLTPESRGWAQARPLRVAFLVENKDHGRMTLDGISADSYCRWGGRFSLVVPCTDGHIPASF